jgi:hypothetical protein
METTYSIANGGRDAKHEYEFAGHSVFDARAVYSRFTTIFSIAEGIVFPRHWDGYFHNDGTRYVNEFVR